MSGDPPAPDFATLLDWVEGRLGPAAAAGVADRLVGGDSRARATVDWLRGFLDTARALPLQQPPPLVRQNVAQHFSRWAQAQAVLGQMPAESRAGLLFDSRRDLVVAGVRGGDDADADADDSVHLAYTTGAGDLLVDVYGIEAGAVRLDGQVLPTDPQGPLVFEAAVTGEDFSVRTVDGDELGCFVLDDVPRAGCELRVSNGQISILAHLDLGPTD